MCEGAHCDEKLNFIASSARKDFYTRRRFQCLDLDQIKKEDLQTYISVYKIFSITQLV